MPKKKKKKKTATANRKENRKEREENRFEIPADAITVIGRWDEETQSVILVEELLTNAALEEVDKLAGALVRGVNYEQRAAIVKRMDTIEKEGIEGLWLSPELRARLRNTRKLLTPKRKKAIVRLPDGAGHVTFLEGADGDPGAWRPSGKRAARILWAHIDEAREGIDKYVRWNMPRGEYWLAAAFARAVGGRIIRPKKPPKFDSVPGRVY